MSWTDDLLAGLAAHLESEAVGSWQPDGAYDPAALVPPIVIGGVPSNPDRLLVLTGYGLGDDAGLTDSRLGVQLRTRGTTDPRTVNDLADAAFDALQGLHDVVLAGIPVTLVHRLSWTPLGTDGNGRHERSDNYRVFATRPTTHRFD